MWAGQFHKMTIYTIKKLVWFSFKIHGPNMTSMYATIHLYTRVFTFDSFVLSVYKAES